MNAVDELSGVQGMEVRLWPNDVKFAAKVRNLGIQSVMRTI